MDHIAIMKKSWKLVEKIESGEKIIESRWYKCRRDPWNKISEGDSIYFKNSGEPVTLKATVSKVLQFDNLDGEKIRKILKRYAKKIALSGTIPEIVQGYKDKRYCILVYLESAKRVKPFSIDKKGFGISSAWLTVENIGRIKAKKK